MGLLSNLAGLLGLSPVDPQSSMEQVSANVKASVEAANEAASKLEDTRKSLEASQKEASQATAQAYATDVQNRKSDLTITAESAASLKEVTPSGVTSISEFTTTNPTLTNFTENLYGISNSALTKSSNSFVNLTESIAEGGTVTIDSYVTAQNNILTDMQNATKTSTTKLASDIINSKVSAAVGDGSICTSSIHKLATTAVSDPNKLVNNTDQVINTATQCGYTYLQNSAPAAALTKSITEKSIASSVATKAMDNIKAVTSSPSLFDKCIQVVQKTTGECMDVYQRRIENVLYNAINDPASYDFSEGFSNALNSATRTCVSNAISGVGSKSVSLVVKGTQSLIGKVEDGVVSTEAAKKASTMMDKAFSLPGLNRVGQVGRKIGKRMMTTYEDKMTNSARRYANKYSNSSQSSIMDKVNNLF